MAGGIWATNTTMDQVLASMESKAKERAAEAKESDAADSESGDAGARRASAATKEAETLAAMKPLMTGAGAAGVVCMGMLGLTWPIVLLVMLNAERRKSEVAAWPKVG